MKPVAATLFALRLPFVEGFVHSQHDRRFSDSIVVAVRDESGVVGFGEGVPRPYVTGETQDSALDHIANDLWPAVRRRTARGIHRCLGAVSDLIPEQSIDNAVSDGASRAALELALLDTGLKIAGVPMGRLLPPRRSRVVYSGVIEAASLGSIAVRARAMRLFGLLEIKVKVGSGDDVGRIAMIREIVGPQVSIRVDANGAWDFDRALWTIRQMAKLEVSCVEQPLPRGAVSEMAELRRRSPVPLMADESLVTISDAESLIRSEAVDYFNVRVSKCGGLWRALRIAQLAEKAHVRLQVGSQVGETAILAAAGRHLAATLESVEFVEGSFGTMLLAEDVTCDSVRFGRRGSASLLRGPGLGVEVMEKTLRKYAARIIELE